MTLLERPAQPPATTEQVGRDGRPPRLSQIVRTWLGFAAIGAGMIHCALAVSAPLPLAIVLASLGLAEFVWGVLTFARDELILPRLARSVAVAPIIVWSLLVVASTLLAAPGLSSSLSLLPTATATAFELFVGAVLSRHLRRTEECERAEAEQVDVGRTDAERGDTARAGRTDAAAPAEPAPGAVRYLLALTLGALVVAGLTTPALAATEAGRYAQPHGNHDADFVPAPRQSEQLSDVFDLEHEHD